MRRRGELLISNVVPILLNGIFITLLILFILKQGSGTAILEERYAKEIALSVDYARPVMIIKMDMRKGMKLANKNGIDFKEVVKIQDNLVRVKLSEHGGYVYSFFNDVDVKASPDEKNNKYTGVYVLTINQGGEG